MSQTRPASFSDSRISLSQGLDLDLQPFLVTGNRPVDLSQHRERISQLHMPGERGERVISTPRNLRHLDCPLQDRHGLLEPPQAAVDRGEHVEAHDQVQTRLTVDGAPLERLGRPERVVQGLDRTLAGGDRVSGELEEEGSEIGVVERHLRQDLVGAVGLGLLGPPIRRGLGSGVGRGRRRKPLGVRRRGFGDPGLGSLGLGGRGRGLGLGDRDPKRRRVRWGLDGD